MAGVGTLIALYTMALSVIALRRSVRIAVARAAMAGLAHAHHRITAAQRHGFWER